ncbi:diguanylate cyclase [Aquifex sp.]
MDIKELYEKYSKGLTLWEIYVYLRNTHSESKAFEELQKIAREFLINEARRDRYIFEKIFIQKYEDYHIENKELIMSHIEWMINFLKDMELLNSHPSVEIDHKRCELGKILGKRSFKDIELDKKVRNIHENLHTLAKHIYSSLQSRNYLNALLNYTKCVKTSHSLINLLSIENLKLVKEANYDPLTGLLNRRQLFRILSDIVDLAKLTGNPFTLAIIDIDNFKQINDKYGHLVGDCILKEIANIMKQSFGKSDYLFRYGGEEFLVIMPSTSLEEALKALERFKENVEKHKFSLDHQECPKVTVSIGVCGDIGEHKDIKGYIDCADKKLYIAKRSGKNRIVWRLSEEVKSGN